MRSLLRRLAVMAGALVLAGFGMVIVGVAPAGALPAGCTATYLCIYPDPGYSGGFGHFSGDNTNWNNFSTSTNNCGNGTWNDCISSAFNDGTSCTVWLWTDANYQGSTHSIARGTGYSRLADVGLNDNVSSNHWCTSRPV